MCWGCAGCGGMCRLCVSGAQELASHKPTTQHDPGPVWGTETTAGDGPWDGPMDAPATGQGTDATAGDSGQKSAARPGRDTTDRHSQSTSTSTSPTLPAPQRSYNELSHPRHNAPPPPDAAPLASVHHNPIQHPRHERPHPRGSF